MGAATVDVSSETSTVVHTGDTLAFELLTWNYGVNAASFGLPIYPTDVNFELVSAPLSMAGGFAVTLESADQTVSVSFASLSFGPGYIQGSGYTGGVSAVQGFLQLSPSLAEALFGGGSAFIDLRKRWAGCHDRLSALRAAAGCICQPVGGTAERRGAARSGGSGKPGKSGRFPKDRFGAGAPVRRVTFGGRSTAVWALPASGTCCAWTGVGATARIINRLHPLIHSDTIYMADRNPPLEPPQIHNGATKSTE